MIISEYINRDVCLSNSRDARFKGVLRAMLPNGSVLLWCYATDIGHGWQQHVSELKVVDGAMLVDES